MSGHCNRRCDKLDVDRRGHRWYATAAYDGFVQGSWKESASHATLGLEVVLGLALPCYVGYLADSHFGTRPFLVLLGLIVGIGHGVRVIRRVIREGDAQAAQAVLEMKRKRAEYYDKRD